ncbi:MAG: glycosyltransferase family 4 protein [Pseudobacteriovorax sp.]|nr:glycosyltransferase family 4 protein [Pseudobacteriovorax sp.]
MLTFISVFAFSFFFVAFIERYYIRIAKKKLILDKPGSRSSHSVPTPRGGGVVFSWYVSFAVFVMYLLGWIEVEVLSIFGTAFLISLLSFFDDLYTLTAKFRLVCHFLIATLLVFILGIDYVFVLPIIFLMVWSTNLYNFMDGINGLASFQGILTMLIVLFLLGGTSSSSLYLPLVLVLVIGALCGFVIWNFPKARVFMGDSGSCYLGYLVAGIAVYFYSREKWVDLIVILGSYIPFVADTSLTLMRRILVGDKISEAHRSHYYQRLHHTSGWSHVKIVVLYTCFTLIPVCLFKVAGLTSMLTGCFALVIFFTVNECRYYLTISR